MCVIDFQLTHFLGIHMELLEICFKRKHIDQTSFKGRPQKSKYTSGPSYETMSHINISLCKA